MDRRDTIFALAALGTVSSVSLAQPAGKVWRIGFLGARSRSTPANPDPYYDAFVQGMREHGYVDGKNIVVEWRYADGKGERLPELAAELVRMNPAVIVTHGTGPGLAMQKATSTIPVVLATLSDPVGSRLIASLGRPGGNVTGMSDMGGDLGPKRLELLKAMVPAIARIAVTTNSVLPSHQLYLKDIVAAGQKLGVTVVNVDVRSSEDIERGFDMMTKARVDGVIVTIDSFHLGQRKLFASLALKHRLPSVFAVRDHVQAGGLMSYGTKLTDSYRRAATYVHKILEGAKPQDLPVEQPTTFELVINRKTANALGLTISREMFLRADEVIE